MKYLPNNTLKTFRQFGKHFNKLYELRTQYKAFKNANDVCYYALYTDNKNWFIFVYNVLKFKVEIYYDYVINNTTRQLNTIVDELILEFDNPIRKIEDEERMLPANYLKKYVKLDFFVIETNDINIIEKAYGKSELETFFGKNLKCKYFGSYIEYVDYISFDIIEKWFENYFNAQYFNEGGFRKMLGKYKKCKKFPKKIIDKCLSNVKGEFYKKIINEIFPLKGYKLTITENEFIGELWIDYMPKHYVNYGIDLTNVLKMINKHFSKLEHHKLSLPIIEAYWKMRVHLPQEYISENNITPDDNFDYILDVIMTNYGNNYNSFQIPVLKHMIKHKKITIENVDLEYIKLNRLQYFFKYD